MPSLSKKLIHKLRFFLICFLLPFCTFSQSFGKLDNIKIQNWIEDIPILPILIENRRDIVEFDSSNGKIISISFDIKNLSKKDIVLFYRDYFKEKKWKRYKTKNIWKTKSKRFKKKIFIIENLNENVSIIKIITENF